MCVSNHILSRLNGCGKRLIQIACRNVCSRCKARWAGIPSRVGCKKHAIARRLHAMSTPRPGLTAAEFKFLA